MWTTPLPGCCPIMGTAESKLQYGKTYSNFAARFLQYVFSDSCSGGAAAGFLFVENRW